MRVRAWRSIERAAKERLRRTLAGRKRYLVAREMVTCEIACLGVGDCGIGRPAERRKLRAEIKSLLRSSMILN